MRKIFVLDTSVIAYDPHSFKEFKNSDLVIPITVLDELDKLKSFANSAGKNARIFIRLLDTICEAADVNKPIKIEGNILLRLDAQDREVRVGDDKSYGDNKILASALSFRKVRGKTREVILVSRDINLRIRARTLGIKAEHYEKDRISRLELYTGMQTIKDVDDGVVLNETGMIDLQNRKYELFPHECVNFVDSNNDGISIGRKIGDRIRVINNQQVWGLEARNREQAFAINMLLDPKMPLISLIGKAGTGKTLIAVAAALEMCLERRKYDKVIIYRPIQAVGNDVGYLPGTLEEKMAPWMGAIMDSFELLFGSKSKDKWQLMMQQYMEKGRIELQPLTYIRGRSIPNAFIIVDEAQNLTKDDVKTILTRAGYGTKIVLTGDIEQIDAAQLDAINNGLTYVVEKFKKSELAGHITFTKGERSPLATEASDLL